MKDRQDPRRIDIRAHSAEPSASGKARAGRLRLSILAVVMALALAMAVAACGDDDDDDGGGGGGGGGEGGGDGGSIALLLPESKTARYESQDRPNFENKVKELCPDCEIIY